MAKVTKPGTAKLAGHDEIMAKESKIEHREGISFGQVENYVTRLLKRPAGDDPTIPMLFGGPGGWKSRYFTKGREFEYLADAIANGFDPKTTKISELIRHRITTGQRLVQQSRLEYELHSFTAPSDGRKLIGEYPMKEDGSGQRSSEKPDGYTVVNIADSLPVLVHDQFAGLFKSLFGEDSIRNSRIGNAFLRLTSFVKHNTLVLDTFHAVRLAYKAASMTPASFKEWSEGNLQLPGRYGAGLALIEYHPRDLARAVAAREITQAQADYAMRSAPDLQALKDAGYNLGRNSENLWRADGHWKAVEVCCIRVNDR